MIQRQIAKKLLEYARQYSVVTVTGPRQSGKTTLCRKLFPKKKYCTLEDLDVRRNAVSDPRGFLESGIKTGMILDEIQRAPELLSYIQTIVDQHKKSGLFILTGSQHFELMQKVTQSLAGRTALATLLPFSLMEIYGTSKKIPQLEKILYTGFYPRIYDRHLNPTEALSFYVGTYLERDIRSLIRVSDLSKFELFIRLCASSTGQILNASRLGNDCGVVHNTVKSWLSILETSYVIQFVQPHHKNFRKRLVKAPKLYFIDPGLAAYLIGIEDAKQLATHPLKGALFETMIVSELVKFRLNQGRQANLFYFRDNVGNEIDLICEWGGQVQPIEIKMTKTLTEEGFKGLYYYRKLNPGAQKGCLIYGGHEIQKRTTYDAIGFTQIEQHFK